MTIRMWAGVVLIVALVWLFTQSWTQHDQTELPTDFLQEFAFGEGRVGQTLVHTFELHNRSARPITVKRIVKDCACTSLTIDNEKIEPGDTEQIRLVIKLPKASELFNAGATVFFDGRPPLKLAARGRILEDVPPRIDFGRFLRGQAVERVFYYRSTRGQPSAVSNLAYNEQLISVVIGRSERNIDIVSVTVRPSDRIECGPFETYLHFELDGILRKIVVAGEILPPAECVPKSLPVTTSGDWATTTIRVRSNYGVPMQLIDVQAKERVQWDEQPATTTPTELAISIRIAVPDLPSGVAYHLKVTVVVLLEGVSHAVPCDVYVVRIDDQS